MAFFAFKFFWDFFVVPFLDKYEIVNRCIKPDDICHDDFTKQLPWIKTPSEPSSHRDRNSKKKNSGLFRKRNLHRFVDVFAKPRVVWYVFAMFLFCYGINNDKHILHLVDHKPRLVSCSSHSEKEALRKNDMPDQAAVNSELSTKATVLHIALKSWNQDSVCAEEQTWFGCQRRQASFKKSRLYTRHRRVHTWNLSVRQRQILEGSTNLVSSNAHVKN